MKVRVQHLFGMLVLTVGFFTFLPSRAQPLTKTKRLGEVDAASRPATYRVTAGDTLWDITDRFYGNPWDWPRLWSYNPEITNPHWIYPDYPLRLSPAGAESASVAAFSSANGLPKSTAKATKIYMEKQGFLDKDALKERGFVAGSPEEHMMLSPYDKIYLQFKSAHPPVGKEVTIFRPIELKALGSDDEGMVIRISGTAKILSYDPKQKLSTAVIEDVNEPIERGYSVAPHIRELDMVDPVVSSQNLRAKVVASIEPVQLMAQHQIVFINAGSKQGVRAGNRFMMVKRGDEWRHDLSRTQEELSTLPQRDEPETYPKEVVAVALVLHVRPQSSTCLITYSTRHAQKGDIVEMRAGF